MANQRQPIELIIRNGKKHLTKAEIAERRESEIKAPSDKIRAPNYLSRVQKRTFNQISKQLISLGILSNLDCDSLARYVISQDAYNSYTKAINDIFSRVDEGETTMSAMLSCLKDLETLRDKAFRQCRQLASDLGLSIAPRCKISVPKQEKPQPPTEDEQLFKAAL